MLKQLIALFVFLVIIVSVTAQETDSDNDGIPDKQELIDGTNPHDASSNKIELVIVGTKAIGETIEIFLQHPALGKIKNVQFTITVKEGSEGSISMNSSNAGFVEFTISKPGLHEIIAKKGSFSIHSYFIPACKLELAPIAGFSFQLQLMVFFLSIVIAALGFSAFFNLLETIDPEYPLRQYPFFFSAFFGVSLFIISFLISLRVSIINSLLFDFVLIVLLVLLIRYLKGKRKIEDKGTAIEALSFLKLLPDFFDRALGRISKSKARQLEMEKMKKQISKKVEKFKTVSTEEKRFKKQHVLEMASESIASFNKYLLLLVGSKKPVMQNKAIEPKKSVQEIVKERKIETMISDIFDQLSSEPLPEQAQAKKKEKPKTEKKAVSKPGFFPSFLARLSLLKKTGITAPPNVLIELFDCFGNELKAKEAQFFLEGKKIKPVKIDNNRAFFKLKKGRRRFHVRLLGFVDLPLELNVEGSSINVRAELMHDVRLLIVDSAGNPLDDAFINISSGKKKAVDVNSEFIWKTPHPTGAPSGTALIALNPLKLPGKMLSIKIVKANYSKKEILIPAKRVSSAEQLKKTIELERIVK